MTIPIPNMIPPTITEIPTGRMWASDGSVPEFVLGTIQLIIAANPIVETPMPTIIPFILCPDPNRNRSRNADAKQNLDLCKVKPNTFATTQTAAAPDWFCDINNPIRAVLIRTKNPTLVSIERGTNRLKGLALDASFSTGIFMLIWKKSQKKALT